jgi:cysteine desulfuration protein SufE
MSTSFEEKQQQIIELFQDCTSKEMCYEKILDLGKQQGALAEEEKVEENRVHGCQSIMYLHVEYDGRAMHFRTESDALISAGLGVLLAKAYSGESPEVVIKCSPDFLEKLGIPAALSPNRVNGLMSLHLKMKQEAVKRLVASS